MAAAAPFLMAGSAALGAIGTLQQGKAQAAALETNAAINRQNANLRRQAAAVEEGRTRRSSERSLATQRVRALKGGVTFSGSILDVIAESARNAELDALNVRYKGALDAHQFLTQAAFQESGAKNAIKASRLSAATQLLSGASQAAGGFKAPTGGNVSAPTTTGFNAGAGNAPAPMGFF